MQAIRQYLASIVRATWFPLAFSFGLATLALLWMSYAVFNYYVTHAEGFGAYSSAQDAAKLGTLGDFFGGVLNPVFGFLSVVGLLVAVVLQREQLVQVKQEALAAAEADEAKAFEGTFFEMLRLQQHMLASVEYTDSEGHWHARAAIARIYQASFSDYTLLEQSQNWQAPEEFLPWLNEFYDDVYLGVSQALEHYFQGIENVAAFLYHAPVRNKAFYARLLRGQFSQFELQMLFFHALRDEAFLFKDYIEALGLLEGLRPENLPDFSLIGLYDASAYGIAISKWGGLRNGKVTHMLEPFNVDRMLLAAELMHASSMERLTLLKERRANALRDGDDDPRNDDSQTIARLEVEVGRLNRLRTQLEQNREEPE